MAGLRTGTLWREAVSPERLYETRPRSDLNLNPGPAAEAAELSQSLTVGGRTWRVRLRSRGSFTSSAEQVEGQRRLTIRIAPGAHHRIRIEVIDNGSGIAAENLTRIFQHGFTTKRTGHGFGLHSGANAAKEMGGSLTVRSQGPGTGATFSLELPISRGKTQSSAASETPPAQAA